MTTPNKAPKSHRAHLHLQERAWPFDPTKYTGHIPTIDGQRKQLVSIIDEHGFNWRVWAVAATGFFTDSYNLFASNIILPCLAFVYWGSEHEANIEITINALTLAGSTVGMIIFGYLADKYGRQRLYGVELMIVIFSTIGLAQSSVGWMNHSQDKSSMQAHSWIMVWRFVMGIGIGGSILSLNLVSSLHKTDFPTRRRVSSQRMYHRRMVGNKVSRTYDGCCIYHAAHRPACGVGRRYGCAPRPLA
jgi:hypothetical protein